MRNSDRIYFCTLNGDTIGASREFTLHYIGIQERCAMKKNIRIPKSCQTKKMPGEMPSRRSVCSFFTQFLHNILQTPLTILSALNK